MKGLPVKHTLYHFRMSVFTILVGILGGLYASSIILVHSHPLSVSGAILALSVCVAIVGRHHYYTIPRYHRMVIGTIPYETYKWDMGVIWSCIGIVLIATTPIALSVMPQVNLNALMVSGIILVSLSVNLIFITETNPKIRNVLLKHLLIAETCGLLTVVSAGLAFLVIKDTATSAVLLIIGIVFAASVHTEVEFASTKLRAKLDLRANNQRR